MMMQQKLVQKPLFCLPNNLKPRDLYSQIVNTLEKHPEDNKLPISVVIYKHFTQNYPCPDVASPAPSAP